MKFLKYIDRGLIFLLGIFSLSLPISKAGINASAGLFIFLSLFKFLFNIEEMKQIYKKNKNILNFSLLIFIGSLINLLSPGGIESAKTFFFKSLYFAMIPGIISILSKKNKKIFAGFFFSSLFIGIVKSYLVFFNEFHGIYKSWIRVHSFYDVGRWSIILLFAMSLLLPLLFGEKNKSKKIMNLLFLTMATISLILSNSRGPWISLVITCLFYFIVYERKKIKYMVLILALLTMLMGTNNKYSQWKDRVISIGNINESSNKGRLVMWREAGFFVLNNFQNTLILTGTGVNNYESIYIEYLKENNKMDLLLQEANQFSFSDNHNIYFDLINQMGILYFLLYSHMFFKLCKEVYEKSKETKNIKYRCITILLFSFFSSGVFYGHIFSYEMFTLFFFISLGKVTERE